MSEDQEMGEIGRLIRALKPMTPAERHAQRRSWLIGEMMLEHPEMTREYVERLVDNVLGPLMGPG